MKIPGLLMKSTCPPKSANAETPEIVEQMVRVVEEDYGDGKRYYTCSVAKGVGDKIGIRPRDAARGAGKRGFVELMEESRLRTEFDGDTADPYRLMRVIA